MGLIEALITQLCHISEYATPLFLAEDTLCQQTDPHNNRVSHYKLLLVRSLQTLNGAFHVVVSASRPPPSPS